MREVLPEVTVHPSGRVEGGDWSDVCGTKLKLRWRRRSPDLARPVSAFRRTTDANVTRERRGGGRANLHTISTQSPGRSGGTVSPESAHDSAQLVEERPWM